MSRYPAIGAVEDAIPHGGVAGVRSDEFVPYHGDDVHPWAGGQGIPHVSDTPWKPTYAELPLCAGVARSTGKQCRAKAVPGEEFCESHKG